MQFLSEKQLSEKIDTKPSTLQSWRWLGKGPAFIKIGGKVRYRIEDVEAWLKSRTHGGDAGKVA